MSLEDRATMSRAGLDELCAHAELHGVRIVKGPHYRHAINITCLPGIQSGRRRHFSIFPGTAEFGKDQQMKEEYVYMKSLWFLCIHQRQSFSSHSALIHVQLIWKRHNESFLV